MSSRKKTLRRAVQRARRFLIYLLTLAFRRALLCLPFSFTFGLTERLAALTYRILGRERRKTLANLRKALGKDKSEEELKRIALEVFKNAGRSLAEILCWPKLGKEYLREHISIQNPEPLLKAYKEGRGMIGLTAHLGNWEYMAAAMANILEIPFAVIAREFSNPWLNRLLEKTRASMGMDVIYRGQSPLAILRRLKSNKGLGILADQDIRGEGIIVDFFGHPAKTHRNVAELILRTGVPVVPIFIIRNKDLTKHTIIIENSLVFSFTGNKETDLKNIAETYTGVIESFIRRYPEQWMWMHNRWSKAKG